MVDPENQTETIMAEQSLLSFIGEMSSHGGQTSASAHIDLQRDRINQIMIFVGPFNPPHIGHINFLKDSFANIGGDMHVACAFVIPCSDRYLCHKFKALEHPLILPYPDRARMCLADRRWPSWAAIPNGDESSAVEQLTRLKTVAASKGYKIRYTVLRGAEWFRVCNGLESQSLGLAPYTDHILVNIWNRHNQDSHHLSCWDLKQKPWEALYENRGLVERYQATVSSRTKAVRAYIRVIRARPERKSRIGSTGIRALCGICEIEELSSHEGIQNAVLSWAMFVSNSTMQQWHKTEMAKRSRFDQNNNQAQLLQLAEEWETAIIELPDS